MAFSPESLGIGRGRPLFLVELDDIGLWPQSGNSPFSFFTAFVAMDAQGVGDDQLRQFAGKCIESRCAWVSTWGPDCERVHDAFDAAYLDAEEASPDQPVLMSTWHDDESLDDALWFALMHGFPADEEEYDDAQISFVAVTTSTQWAAAIRRRLVNIDAFTNDVLADDPT